MVGTALAAVGLLGTGVLAAVLNDAGTVDVQVPTKQTSQVDKTTTQGSYISYFGDSDNTFGSSGTGTFTPFVRLQGSPTEQGYNTNGATQFDTKTGTWTHAIKVSEIPVRPCPQVAPTMSCFELFVDINETNSAKHVSLNTVDIWFTQDANLTGYPFTATATTTNQYKFQGAILINDVNQGSGRGDLRYDIPISDFTIPANCNYGNTACATYFVLYSQWGTSGNIGNINYNSEGGFEEWKVRVYPVSPDISVAKTPDAGSINGGANAVFNITVTNNGPVTATNVTLSDTLPTGFTWTLGGTNAGSCGISAGVLTCNFGSVLNGGTRTISLTAPTTTADCGTINNTVTVSATGDVAPVGNNTDPGDIAVSCGALQITKTAKHADTSGDTTADLAATFDITDSNGDVTQLTTDATGVGCVAGIAVGLTQSIVESSVPAGYSAPTIGNVTVASGDCSNVAVTNVNVENTPLTDVTIAVDSQHDGATSTLIECWGPGSDPATDPADFSTTVSDGSLDIDDLDPSDPAITLNCQITVDP
jgi:uncharacterized repeat protein (TIGR01451 family)